MRNLKLIVPILILLVTTASGFQHESQNRVDGTIFLGEQYSFILKEPTGWILDGSTAKSQGVDAVLYRQGSSWKDAVAVMYARVIRKDEKKPTLERLVQEDVSDFVKQNHSSQVSEAPALLTRDKKRAVVKNFYDAENRNYESVAYIDESKVVVILALSSRNKDQFEKSLPAFRALAGSYFFVKELVDPK